jgi:hypothetical protein
MVLVDKKEQDLLAMDHLTEGEAKWMGCQLRDMMRSEWSKTAAKPQSPRPADGLLWDRELDS